jgi:hypothetical protein
VPLVLHRIERQADISDERRQAQRLAASERQRTHEEAELAGPRELSHEPIEPNARQASGSGPAG